MGEGFELPSDIWSGLPAANMFRRILKQFLSSASYFNVNLKAVEMPVTALISAKHSETQPCLGHAGVQLLPKS
jgi:hypothetical protein